MNSYYIPEDGDSEDHPNIFLMSKPTQTQSGFSPRLKDIRDSFPMPGKYHFRFKAPLIPGTDREKGSVAVWMDCTDDSQHVGVWRNTIFAKVTRINMDDDDDDDFHAPAAAAPVHAPAPAPAQRRAQHARAPAPAPPRRAAQPQPQYPPQQQRPTPVPAHAPSENLLGNYHEHPSTSNLAPSSEGNLFGNPNPAAAHGHEGSLLDMNEPAYHSGNSNVSSNSNHDVFLGMTSQPVQATHTPPVSAPLSAPVPAPAPASYGNPLAGGAGGARLPAQNNATNAFSKSGPFGGLEWK